MADDTRPSPQGEDLSKEALTVNPENKPFSGAQWRGGKAQPYRPPENANMMPGGTEHTAGGKIPEVSLSSAFQGGLKWSDFAELPKRPCVRDALITGIGSGAALGGMRVIFKASVWTACSWAVGTFCGTSATMYQWCQYRRTAEKEGMMRAVEILNKKDLEKRAREARKSKVREEREGSKEKEQETQSAAMRETKQAKTDGGGEKAWWEIW